MSFLNLKSEESTQVAPQLTVVDPGNLGTPPSTASNGGRDRQSVRSLEGTPGTLRIS